MTAMFEKAMNERVNSDKDRFTATELAALRSDLLQGGMIDSYEAAELLQAVSYTHLDVYKRQL